jgi:uncharacterized membrane protein YdjX (TVP38/TMEM64 family)
MSFPPGDSPTGIGAAGARARFWVGLLVLALLLAAVQLLHPQALFPGVAARVREAGWVGLLLIGLLYVPAALTAVPVAILTFTAGWLFGPAVAFLVAVPACTASACAAFGVGRIMAGDPRFLARGGGRIARLARALESRRGFWTVVLLRLSPVTPFALLNFAFGATPVRLSTYALATLVGSIPACLGFAIAGAVLGGR